MPPLPRWAPVLVLLVVNLLPLWLVLDGSAETADLLMSYVLETWALLLLALPEVPRVVRWGFSRRDVRGGPAVLLGLLLVPVGLVAMTFSVVAEVTWDTRSALSILGVALSLVVGLVLTWWQHGSPVPGRTGAAGAFAWRFVLLVCGALIGLNAARSYEELLAHGWEPAPLGDGWAYPVGQRLIETAIALDLSAAVVPAFFLVSVRTVNEVLHEVFLALTDRRAAPELEPEPAST